MSKKNRDLKGRWRYKTVSFRASDEEIRELNEMVYLSGLTKQEYIVSKLLNKDVVIKGNSRVYYALKTKMNEIIYELKNKTDNEKISLEELSTIKIIFSILEGFKGDY